MEHTVADERGIYRFAGISPGEYRVTLIMRGFVSLTIRAGRSLFPAIRLAPQAATGNLGGAVRLEPPEPPWTRGRGRSSGRGRPGGTRREVSLLQPADRGLFRIRVAKSGFYERQPRGEAWWRGDRVRSLRKNREDPLHFAAAWDGVGSGAVAAAETALQQ